MEDISQPDRVVENGTQESCTATAFIDAVALGDKIVFGYGSEPITIKLTKTTKIFNYANNDIVIDGGGVAWVRDGRLKMVNYRFFNNVYADLVPDVGGGTVRVFSQFENKTSLCGELLIW